ncbi:hypothetical protein GOBAR_DD23504 [Gossypium barbadense]|nr:hypothetical protein GOBAR_DD23504 [Gossypium barbadense]
MGCTVREKHRSTRRTRSVKPDTDHPCCVIDKDSVSKSILESGLKSLSYHLSLNDSTQSPNPNHNTSNTNFDDHGLGYCTEEQLEEFLLKNLEFLYNEAISKLVSLGYDEDVALKAILRNGHCYGGMDVLTNILHNSLAYLNSSCGSSKGSNSEEAELGFPDIRQLQEYSLAGMVCLLQQVRPHLSKGDAMWCLLMSDLHVGKASTMEIPSLPSPANGCSLVSTNMDSIGNNGVSVVSPALCRFHGGWGFGNGGAELPVNGFFSNGMEMTLQREIECPERFNLSPSMKSLLKRNVAMFAASFRANSKQLQAQNHALPSGDAPLAVTGSKWKEELKAKELALAQLEQERRSKEAAEASNKRKLEALRLKIEIDFQRHKDDHQRLEQELSRLKQSTDLNHQSDNLLTGKSEGAKPLGETIARLLHELDKQQDSSENNVNGDRECIICSKDEVSVVFLPCAHQVLCANCNDDYGKKGKATCPCCRVPIEQRIRVFGATS